MREPGNRQYGEPLASAILAKESWEYALLSARAYDDQWQGETTDDEIETSDDTAHRANDPTLIPINASHANKTEEQPEDCNINHWNDAIQEKWIRWDELPSPDLRDLSKKRGLYFDVYHKELSHSKRTVAVVFRGTEGSWLDWRANLRWFTRFLPRHEDQYMVTADLLMKEFANEYVRKGFHEGETELVATGHSLGGGLAQHFAYSLASPEDLGISIEPVSHVYAFNPSPVTGWYSIGPALRKKNAEDLTVDRIFEHGEILAFLRLFLSYFYPPSAASPAIREIRFDFLDSSSVTENHAMATFACELAASANGSSHLPLGE